MTSFRHQFFIAFAVLLVFVAAASAVNFVKGSRQARDGVVCRDNNVNVRAQPGRVVTATRICKVPRYNQTITYVFAQDRGIRGRGGYAQIQRGGIGQKNVTLYLWSQPSQPLNFTIEVYAKPYW